ncbi:MAG: hypothetical protein ACRDJE_04495 [Dehalococcoidia bacterium]
MTSEQTNVLVFKDQAEDYFLLPQETLERGRVPEEHKAEVDRLLAEADADVSGYMVAITYTLLRAINCGAIAIGNAVEDAAAARLLEQLQGPSSGSGPAGQT